MGGGRGGMGVDCVVFVFTLVTLCCQVFYLDSLLLSFFVLFFFRTTSTCVCLGRGRGTPEVSHVSDFSLLPTRGLTADSLLFLFLPRVTLASL